MIPLEIELTQGKVAIVGEGDFERVSELKWYFDDGYAVRNRYREDGKQTRMSMHRFIMGPRKGFEVDHINGNTLDNRRENLRICTHRQNMQNQRMRKSNASGFKGVHLDKRNSKWVAQIQLNGRRKFLGYFASPELAAKTYDQVSAHVYGQFGVPNSNLQAI